MGWKATRNYQSLKSKVARAVPVPVPLPVAAVGVVDFALGLLMAVRFDRCCLAWGSQGMRFEAVQDPAHKFRVEPTALLTALSSWVPALLLSWWALRWSK